MEMVRIVVLVVVQFQPNSPVKGIAKERKVFDFGIKSNWSYGEKGFDELVDWGKRMEFSAMSITDLFSVSHNQIVGSPGFDYIFGSEFYCKMDSERVDLIFVDFDLTPELLRFESNWKRLWAHTCRKLEDQINFEDSWFRPEEFGKIIREQDQRKLYLNALPNYDVVMKEFKLAGAKVILNRVPFVENKSARMKLIKKIAEDGLLGVVVFRDVSQYGNQSEETGENLDICAELDIAPIVASGVYDSYDAWEVVGAEAKGTFKWLADEVLKRLDGNR